jgi:hypothetical protein
MRMDESQGVRTRRWPAVLGVVVLTLMTVGAFLAYLRPDFVVDLANRMFLCS